MTTEAKPAEHGILAFNRWSVSGILVEDPGLRRYVSLHARIVPRSNARYAGKRFHKSKVFIVERLMNKLMVPGHRGKKHKVSSAHAPGATQKIYDAVYRAFGIIERRVKENPLKVLVKALENAAPREEIVTIEYGGARYPKAVDCAPQRRVDVVLRLFVVGTYDRCFNKKMSLAEALAEELIAAYRLDQKSAAIQKKLDLERQSDSAR